MNAVLRIVVPFLLFVIATGVVLLVTGRMAHRDGVPRAPAGTTARPWWGSPLPWFVACAVFALLGLVVAPKLFGVAILFLPFVWVGGLGKRRRS